MTSCSSRVFSSENDLDEVFMGKAGGGMAQTAKLATARNVTKVRAFTDPNLLGNLKKDGKKDETKGSAKVPALSDSSNAQQRQRHASTSVDAKLECSPILEDVSQFCVENNNWNIAEKPSRDGLPEPESMRQTAKDSFFIPFFEDAETTNDAAELNEHLPEEIGGVHSFVTGTETHPDGFGDDDDDTYPDIEHIPAGYDFIGFDDYSHSLLSPPRTVLRAYDENNFPPLPDDMFKDEEAKLFQEVANNLDFDLSPAEMSVIPEPDCTYEMKLNLYFGDEC